MLNAARRSLHEPYGVVRRFLSQKATQNAFSYKEMTKFVNKTWKKLPSEDAKFVSAASGALSAATESGSRFRPVDLNRAFMTHQVFRKKKEVGPGREARYNDPFIQLSIDPRWECENKRLMNFFVSRMGKVTPRNVTGLTQRSQRLLGKAIKRARMMGVLSRFSRFS